MLDVSRNETSVQRPTVENVTPQPVHGSGCKCSTKTSIRRWSNKVRRASTQKDLCVNILESENPEIHVMESRDYMPFDVVLDPGAADHVVDNADTPGYTIHESPGSKAGSCFIAANGERIPNKGEVRLEMKSGQIQITSTFQVSEISKPLWSVEIVRRWIPCDIQARHCKRHT